MARVTEGGGGREGGRRWLRLMRLFNSFSFFFFLFFSPNFEGVWLSYLVGVPMPRILRDPPRIVVFLSLLCLSLSLVKLP